MYKSYFLNGKKVAHININYSAIAKTRQKRVLVSYISQIYEIDPKLWKKHTNIIECSVIVKIFTDLGFIVDIYNFDDVKNFNKNNFKYDIIFGIGEVFRNACEKNKNSIKILYLLGSGLQDSLVKYQDRVKYYEKRHGKKKIFTNRLEGNIVTDNMLQECDYAIFFGNDFTKMTYSSIFNKLFLTTPSALVNDKFVLSDKNFSNIKHNFLWFGSGGAIHKGLDVLIDAVKLNTNLTLYIAGLSFFDEHLFDIKDFKNIVNLGYIDVQSENFINLVNNVCFVVLPSCSEGMATSVLTCMSHGLIPIITKEVGIDIDNERGFILEHYDVSYIAKKLEECSSVNNKILQEMSIKSYEFSRNNYSINSYYKKIKSIFLKIINSDQA